MLNIELSSTTSQPCGWVLCFWRRYSGSDLGLTPASGSAAAASLDATKRLRHLEPSRYKQQTSLQVHIDSPRAIAPVAQRRLCCEPGASAPGKDEQRAEPRQRRQPSQRGREPASRGIDATGTYADVDPLSARSTDNAPAPFTSTISSKASART